MQHGVNLIKPPIIPALSSQIPAEVRRAFDSLKPYYSALAAQGGSATLNDLQQAGIVDSNGAIVTSLSDSTVPPALVNFAAHGAFRTIMLTWDNPNYRSFSYVEIWRAEINNLGQAVMIGT